MKLPGFREVWCVDFEFRQLPGELPTPICVVTTELNSSRWVRLFTNEMPSTAPYSIDDDSLFIAFAASADLFRFDVQIFGFAESNTEEYRVVLAFEFCQR